MTQRNLQVYGNNLLYCGQATIIGTATAVLAAKASWHVGKSFYSVSSWGLSHSWNAIKWIAKNLVGSTPAGTAVGLTYKYSVIPAEPQKKEKRSIVVATSVFVLTLLTVRYLNSKFNSHQMSLSEAFSYASISAITSLFAVAVTSQEKITNPKWNESVKMGIYAGIASGVASGIANAVVCLGMKSIFAFRNTFSIIKGSIPTAVILAPTFALAKEELNKKKYGLNEVNKELSSLAIAAILGAALTPTFSSFMVKKKVGYLASAGYSLAPILGRFFMNIDSEEADLNFFNIRRKIPLTIKPMIFNGL